MVHLPRFSHLFLGLVLQLIVLKIGGAVSYRRLRPLLLGLVLGESFIGGIWIVEGLFRLPNSAKLGRERFSAEKC